MWTLRPRNHSVLLTFFLLHSIQSFGQERETYCIAILDSIYNQNFKDATLLLDRVPAPNQPLKGLLEIQLMRWRHVPVNLSPEADLYLNKLNALDESFDKVQQGDLQHYLKICQHFLLAEFHFANNNQWQAIHTMQKVYPLVLQSFQDSIGLPEHDFIKGIYLYYADHYFHKNFTGKIIFSSLKKGDRLVGLRLLSKVAFSESIAGVEAAIYYGHILLHHERNPDGAISVYEKLCARYPRNIKFKELYAECLIAARQYIKAEMIVAELLDAENPFYHGGAYLFRGILKEDFLNDSLQAKDDYVKSRDACGIYGSVLQRYRLEAEARLNAATQR